MSSDDDFDRELRDRLRAGAPSTPDPEAELDSLRPRFRQARQRRQAMIAGLSTAAAVLLVVVGVGVLGGDREQAVTISDDPNPSTTTTAPTTIPSTTVPTVPSTTTVPTTTVPTTPTLPGGRRVTVPPVSTPTVPTTSAPPPASPTTTVPTGGTTTLTSEGGNATVSWTPSRISVLSTAPAAGWELERVDQQEPTRVVVKFRRSGGGSGSSSASIDARIVDGRLRVD